LACRMGGVMLTCSRARHEVRIVADLPLIPSGRVGRHRWREQALLELGRDPHEDVFARPAAE